MLKGINKDLPKISFLILGSSLIFTGCSNDSSKEKNDAAAKTVEDSDAYPVNALNADTIYYSEVPGAIKIVREKIMKEADAVEIAKRVERYKQEIDKIKKKNPDLKYTYMPASDGKIKSLVGNYRTVIQGIKDSLEIERFALLLEAWVTDRNRLREYENIVVRAEREAAPVMGYEKLYEKIQSNIDYPFAAREQGVEGTAFVQFDINENGEVRNVEVVDTDYGSKNTAIISKLNRQAKEAIIATSGDWAPAQQGEQPVASTLEIPITFDFKAL